MTTGEILRIMWVKKFPEDFKSYLEYLKYAAIQGNQDLANIDQLPINPFKTTPYSLEWSVVQDLGTGTFQACSPNKDYWTFNYYDVDANWTTDYGATYHKEQQSFLASKFQETNGIFNNFITEFYLENKTLDEFDVSLTFKVAQVGGHYAFEYNQT